MAEATIPFLAHTPITIAAANDAIIVRVGVTDYTADVADGTYYVLGDGSAADLLLALKTALDASGSGLTYTVTIDGVTAAALAAGLLNISAGAAFTLKFSSASWQFPQPYLGWPSGHVVDTSSSDEQVSPNQIAGLWSPEDYAYTRDNRKERQIIQARSVAGVYETRRLSESDLLDLRWDIVERAKTRTTYAAANEAFEVAWEWMSDGGKIYWIPDVTDLPTNSQWVARDEDWKAAMDVGIVLLEDAGGERYRIDVPLIEHKAVTSS